TDRASRRAGAGGGLARAADRSARGIRRAPAVRARESSAAGIALHQRRLETALAVLLAPAAEGGLGATHLLLVVLCMLEAVFRQLAVAFLGAVADAEFQVGIVGVALAAAGADPGLARGRCESRRRTPDAPHAA